MKLLELIEKLEGLFFFPCLSHVEDVEITDIRINENGKWIEFEFDGFKEVINIEEE